MISQYKTQAFLNKPCDVHTWVKELSEEVLDEQIAKIHPKPHLHPDLKKHQKACFLLGVAYPQFYHMLDLGAGKTLLTLALLQYFMQVGRLRKWALVLVPTDELIDSWETEIQKWCPELPYVALTGTTREKWETLEGFKTGLVIGTYVGVSIMMCHLRQVAGRKTRKHTLVQELLDQFVPNINALVCDQSTKIGNVTSLSYSAVKHFSQHAKIRYNLAGRPFARDPIILWSQFYIIDHGLTLTPQFGFFREVFFDKKKAFWGGPGTFEYKFRKKMEPQLARLIGHRSIRYSKLECTDLPARTFIRRKVTFPGDMQAYYRRIVDEVLQNRYSYKEMENAFVRMRQICSGFVGFRDSEGDKVQLDFKLNPKMDELLELVDDMPEDSKAIIYYEFTYSGKKISEELKRRKIKHGWLWSGTKNWPEMKRAFDTDPEFKVLVNQYRKGGIGLNLQAADYTFYYESPVSALDREESEGRNYRQGQQKPVIVYDLVVKDSIEENILAFHKEGNNIFQALVKDPVRVLKVA